MIQHTETVKVCFGYAEPGEIEQFCARRLDPPQVRCVCMCVLWVWERFEIGDSRHRIETWMLQVAVLNFNTWKDSHVIHDPLLSCKM